MDAHNQDMFDECMAGMDRVYDESAGFLRHVFLPYGANVHDTRATIGYAVGLLERNQGKDRYEAVRIIQKVIGTQYKDPTEPWYPALLYSGRKTDDTDIGTARTR